jgi:hypothetical protein
VEKNIVGEWRVFGPNMAMKNLPFIDYIIIFP